MTYLCNFRQYSEPVYNRFPCSGKFSPKMTLRFHDPVLRQPLDLSNQTLATLSQVHFFSTDPSISDPSISECVYTIIKTNFTRRLTLQGPVRFKDNSRRGNVVIKQMVASNEDGEKMVEHCIGEYSGVTRTLYLERCGRVFWAADRPPKDRTIIR